MRNRFLVYQMKEELRKEFIRKTFHFLGLAYIPAITFIEKDLLALAIIIATLAAIALEFFRRIRTTPLNSLLREYEQTRVPGYLYTGVAFSIITPFFTVNACMISAVTAFAGDGVAGIVKRMKPKLAIPAFILSSLALVSLLPLNLLPATLSITISSLLDGRKLEDNFTIPVASAIIYETLEILFRM